MSFRRELLPDQFKTGSELDNDLHAIGINISCERITVDPNIEDTLIAATLEGLNKNDGRIMGLVVDWIFLYSLRINVDRLSKVLMALTHPQKDAVIVFFSAIAQSLSKDSRFKKITSFYNGRRRNYLSLFPKGPDKYDPTDFLIQKNGEDGRFKETCLRVPKKVLRHRPTDIFLPDVIAKRHMGFRYRIMMGASYRADLWALLRRDATRSAYEIAKRAYCSYETARQAKRDYIILKRNYSDRKVA